MASDDKPRNKQPVEPEEARAHGNEPDAVRFEGSEETRHASRGEETVASSGDRGARTEEEDPGRRADPDQDAGRWRARGPLTETYASGGHGARLDSEEGGRDQGSHSGADGRHTADRGTSWPSVIYGWLAAVGGTLVLSTIVGAVVGTVLGVLGAGGADEGGIAGLVGLITTLFLAFLIGGYVAGRMASRSGLKHGLFVPLLALVLTLLLAVAGGALGLGFAEQLSGAALPGPLQDAAQQAQGAVQGVQQPQNLDTILTVSGILALLAPFVGGALGGVWGAARGRNRP